MSYDDRFFASIREGSQRSAAALVPVLRDRFGPSTVVDVGCGEGWFGKAFESSTCEVLGLDDQASPVIPSRQVDLREELPPFEGKFDLAVCLEVAEHLPPERAESFVADLCRLSDTIVFSAAMPGQGGTGHLNEQWPEYWAEPFRSLGYGCSDFLRWEIWDDKSICWWYRQNIFVAVANGAPVDQPLRPVIHPGAWAHFGHA